MKDYFNNYLIVGQIISFLLVPPLLAFIICERTQTTAITKVLAIVGSAIFGVAMAITFLIKIIKRNERKKQNNEKN